MYRCNKRKPEIILARTGFEPLTDTAWIFFRIFFFFLLLLLHKLLLSPFCLILPLALDQAPWWDKKQKTGWKAQKKKISEPSEPSGWLRRERDGVLSLSLVPRLAHFVRLPIVFALLFTPFFAFFSLPRSLVPGYSSPCSSNCVKFII